MASLQIDDMPTRFRYTKVAASSYALTPAEILLATDAELNSYMSLRKMAPYRSDGGDLEKPKGKKKLKELRDAVKQREWGVEIDEEAEAERREKKERWRKEGKGEVAAVKSESAKRLGKKERKRRALAAEGGSADP